MGWLNISMVYANTGLGIRNLLLLVQIQLLLVQIQVWESKTRFCNCAKLNNALSLAEQCLTTELEITEREALTDKLQRQHSLNNSGG